MKHEGFRDREHSIADLMLLLAAVCLAVATWVNFSDPPSVPLWKSYTAVLITELLALAALTRNARWAGIIRLVTGGWLITAPYLLDFAQFEPARWTYLAIGVLVTTLGLPGIALPPRSLPTAA